MADLDDLGRTALVPFWARLQDARSANPVLADNAALSLADRVRERFGEIDVGWSTRVGCCLRNRIVDEWVARIVGGDTGPAVVVDIGVGLDTRLRRRPDIAARYVEVDSDPVIRLRDAWLPNTGAVRVPADGMRPTEWIGHVDRNTSGVVVLVLEGVLAYQTPERVARFLAQTTQSLPGAYLVFDSLSPYSAWLANRSGEAAQGRPRYQWSTWRTSRITVGRARLRVLEEKGFMDLPASLRRSLPVWDRLLHAMPPMRRSYRFTLARLPQ